MNFVYNCIILHFFSSFFICALVSLIIELISSRLISGRPRLCASSLSSIRAKPSFLAPSLSCLSFSDSTSNGIFSCLTTVRAKILNAVFALIPKSLQSSSNLFLVSESIRTVNAVCAIIILFGCKYTKNKTKMQPKKWSLEIVFVQGLTIAGGPCTDGRGRGRCDG